MGNSQQTILSTNHSNWALGFRDVYESLIHWRIWLMLGWQDIRMRYRRSCLGPLWITASTAVMIYSMGFLYSHLLAHATLKNYFPELASGIVSWQLISQIIIETNDALVEATSLLTQQKLPYTLFLWRIVLRNLLVFFHNLLAVIPAIIIFKVPITFSTLFLVISLLLIVINSYTYGTILLLLGSRYRDIKPLIASLVQVAFFLTPVIWSPTALPEKYRFLLDFNPFAQFIQLCRQPLLGHMPPITTLLIVTGMTFLGITIMFPLFCQCRRHIIYWL